MNNKLTHALSIAVVTVCSIRFLFDGISFHGLTFSHMDSLSYTAILTPVLAAHSYIKNITSKVGDMTQKVVDAK